MECTRLAYLCATTCGVNSEKVDILPGGTVDARREKNWSCPGKPRVFNVMYPLLVSKLLEGFI